MARLTEAELQAHIAQAVQNAGGVLTHNELIEQMQAANVALNPAMLESLVRNKRVLASVDIDANGLPKLTYRMPQ